MPTASAFRLSSRGLFRPAGRRRLSLDRRCPCLGGNPALLKEHGIETAPLASQLERLADEGKTPLCFASGNRFLGLIAVADLPVPRQKPRLPA
jgi:hypothetical protein